VFLRIDTRSLRFSEDEDGVGTAAGTFTPALPMDLQSLLNRRT
jgi:hypothetical protein